MTANYIAVGGNAIISDSTSPVNIDYTSLGAIVTPKNPAPTTGVFQCSLPNAPNGAIIPISVQINQVESNSSLASVNQVQLYNNNTLVAQWNLANLDTMLNAGLTIATRDTGTGVGGTSFGWNLSVTVLFSQPSSMTVSSLEIQF